MEYTIHQLADLAGISTRTLRYYDQIHLLPVTRADQSGYRIYGEKEVDTLQQILFLKELGFELGKIAEMISTPSFHYLSAMEDHLHMLRQKEQQLQKLICTIEKTIQKEKGETIMTDQEKFEGFKQEIIQENERKYGKEIRERYGDQAIEESNRKIRNLSEEGYQKMTALSDQILEKLNTAVGSREDYKSGTGKEIALLHKEWLSFTWSHYSAEAHRGLSDMYIKDPRFTAWYDKEIPGCAQFLRDAIHFHIL